MCLCLYADTDKLSLEPFINISYGIIIICHFEVIASNFSHGCKLYSTNSTNIKEHEVRDSFDICYSFDIRLENRTNMS